MLCPLQVLAAVMSVFERRFGIRSSSLLSLLWLSLVVYGAIKLRTIILVTLDSVREDYTLHYTTVYNVLLLLG